jgi:hypothetical protein
MYLCTDKCMYMHTHLEQGQDFLSCHCVCLIAVRIDSSYEYGNKMAAIKGISRYASCHCYFNTVHNLVHISITKWEYLM